MVTVCISPSFAGEIENGFTNIPQLTNKLMDEILGCFNRNDSEYLYDILYTLEAAIKSEFWALLRYTSPSFAGEMENGFPNIVQLTSKLMDEILRGFNRNDSQCLHDILYTLEAAMKSEFWALLMLDASSKPPSGLLSGNVNDLGAYDQCLRVVNQKVNNTITGKYCMLSTPAERLLKNAGAEHTFQKLYFNDEGAIGALSWVSGNPRITFALCVPNSCDKIELNDMFSRNDVFKKMQLDVMYCQPNEEEDTFTTIDWVALAIFIILGMVISLSTTYDLLLVYFERKLVYRIFVAFSLYTNGKRLFTINKSSNQLRCLNGLRSISIFWIVLGHTVFNIMEVSAINTLDVPQFLQKTSSMYANNATLSVDTFFFLTGLLISYLYMTKKGKKFNIFAYYIHRYVRLTPSLAALILLHVSLLRFMGSGPFWPAVMSGLRTGCMKYWWSSLLYVQNYVNPNELCLMHTWYLSVDTQLYVLSPLVLIPLAKWPKQTLCCSLLLILLSIGISFSIAWVDKIPGVWPVSPLAANYLTHYYYNIIARYGPFLAGIILGYFMAKGKEIHNFDMLLNNPVLKLGGWVIALSTLFVVVFGPTGITKHTYVRIESSTYIGLHSIAWTVALSWIVYACVTEHGGIINGFLSLPVFQILSRLTYSMYLISASFQEMKAGSLRVPLYISDFQIIYNFWGDLVFTIFLSIIWTLIFESPVMVIEDIIRNRQRNKEQTSL